MKIKRINTEEPKPEFKPATLEITIESRDELMELWHRLNIHLKTLDSSGYTQPDYYFPDHETGRVKALWQALDSIVIERDAK